MTPREEFREALIDEGWCADCLGKLDYELVCSRCGKDNFPEYDSYGEHKEDDEWEPC